MPEQELPIDNVHDDAKAAYDEVTQGPAHEPEPAVEAKPEPEVAEKPADDRPRDEQGRFVAKDEKEEAPEVKPEKVAEPIKEPKTETAPVTEPQAAPSLAGGPPGGWSVKSKAEWDKLPNHIRADIIKRETEVNTGFAEYSGMKPLKRYVELARQSGTTLEAALDKYIAVERLLRQDPLRAISTIAQNVGISPQQLAQAFQPYLGAGQSNGHADPSGAQPPDLAVLQQWLNPVQQEVSQLKQLLNAQQEAERSRSAAAVSSALERFTKDPKHRYYENVEPRMIQMFETNYIPRSGDHMADLERAYEAACWEDPEIRDLMINERSAKAESERKAKEKDAAEKARQASRSITGSPGSAVRDDDAKGDGSIEDDARAAYRSVMSATRV